MIRATFLQVIIVLMGIFMQAVLGLCDRAHFTESAAAKQWVAK
jgi:hypothetical protein